MVHKNILITGVVQGVGFRYSARKVAAEYGITGFVRNLPDGAVYIEAEGNTQDTDRFIAWCSRGPAHAIVRKIEVTDNVMRNFTGFIITR